jgi:SAM-dependent methyltransferase
MSGAFDPVRFKQTTRDQWDAAAGAWHDWGPTLEAWLGEATELMLDLARVEPGSRVLDVAAGAGGQTLTTARRVGPAGAVLATDISAAILDHAAADAARAGLTNVATRAMDGEALEVEDETFDAAISRLGLMYFPDRQRALSEIRRVLRPGGRVAAIAFSTPERNGFFSVPVSIVRRHAQLPPAAPGLPGPFSLAAPGAIEDELRGAGFTEIDVRLVDAPLRMTSAAECLQFERESFGALHQMLSGLDEGGRRAAWDEIGDALRAFEGPDGFVGPCELIVAGATG